jgi:hypothetical protein
LKPLLAKYYAQQQRTMNTHHKRRYMKNLKLILLFLAIIAPVVCAASGTTKTQSTATSFTDSSMLVGSPSPELLDAQDQFNKAQKPLTKDLHSLVGLYTFKKCIGESKSFFNEFFYFARFSKYLASPGYYGGHISEDYNIGETLVRDSRLLKVNGLMQFLDLLLETPDWENIYLDSIAIEQLIGIKPLVQINWIIPAGKPLINEERDNSYYTQSRIVSYGGTLEKYFRIQSNNKLIVKVRQTDDERGLSWIFYCIDPTKHFGPLDLPKKYR